MKNKFVPRNVLRIVMQVLDTPENQIAMRKAVSVLLQVHIPDRKNAIVKAEQVAIVSASFAKPSIESKPK